MNPAFHLKKPMYELSVVVPGNNEQFHSQTIDDLVKNSKGKTEIIAVIDGGIWPKPSIKQYPNVNVIFLPTAVGQRAATNVGARLSNAKYLAKVDAHTSYDEGWDVKMLEFFKEHGDNITAVPVMRNLHAFDWKCLTCGSRWYQGPTPTKCHKMEGNHSVPNEPCKGNKFERIIVWRPRPGTHSTSYCFDAEPHFQYFNEYKTHPDYIAGQAKGVTETMSLQGSFFMSTRKKYWELKLSDESVGSWGNQGLEVACKTWLSGGRVLVNHKTWYAHMFRTQGGDFSFPYKHINDVDSTKKRVWDYFFNGKFKGQIHKPSWLVEKFWPIPVDTRKDEKNGIGWTQQDLDSLKEKERQSSINML